MRIWTIALFAAGCAGGGTRPAAPVGRTNEPAPAEQPEPPPNATTVPIAATQGHRYKGEMPHISDLVLPGRHLVIVKLCVTADGVPAVIELAKPSGSAAADRRIHDAMAQWRYRPFHVDGKPVPWCTAVTFKFDVAEPAPE
jgi:TonB family protein